MASEPKTEIMCFLPKAVEECRFAIDAAGHKYKQTDKFAYLGVDPLLYGYATWSLSAANYTALSGAHRKFLTRVIGWRRGKRMDHPLSYAKALTRAGCT